MNDALEVLDVEYLHGPGPTLVGDTATELGRIRFALNRMPTADESGLLIPQGILPSSQDAWVYIEPGMDIVTETKRARDAIAGTSGALAAKAAQEAVLREAGEAAAEAARTIDTELSQRLREELELD